MTIKSTAVNLEEKASAFLDILERQFTGCGKKYTFNETSEWTDVIVMYVPCWVEGTILKYLGRLKVYGRERDWIKIATYCFILWIKYGLHSELEERFAFNTHCTTVEEKAKYWPEFRKAIETMIKGVPPRVLGGKDWTTSDLRKMFSEHALIDDMFFNTTKTIECAKFGPWKDCKQIRSEFLICIALDCLLSWIQDGFYEAQEHDEDLDAEKEDVEDITRLVGHLDGVLEGETIGG